MWEEEEDNQGIDPALTILYESRASRAAKGKKEEDNCCLASKVAMREPWESLELNNQKVELPTSNWEMHQGQGTEDTEENSKDRHSIWILLSGLAPLPPQRWIETRLFRKHSLILILTTNLMTIYVKLTWLWGWLINLAQVRNIWDYFKNIEPKPQQKEEAN